MDVLNNKTRTVGSELSLECNVTTVRGITSELKVVWMKNYSTIEKTDNSRIIISSTRVDSDESIVYASTLQFLYLSEDDENVYSCSVTIIGTETSMTSDYELNNFNGKFILHNNT